MRFLILTDHRGHSDQNSLYALARTLVSDPRADVVLVASRGNSANDSFFAGELSAALAVTPATANFAYDPTGRQFTQTLLFTTLTAADVVWLRLPPPAEGPFFTALSYLAPASSPRIINDPAGVLLTGNKAFLLNFPEWTPPTLRAQTAAELRAFAEHHPLVLKPLTEYGGRGLVRIREGRVETDGRSYPLDDWLVGTDPADYLAMQYLKNVTEGDKRILVVNGRILGASLRLPAPGEWLCNVARGGTSILAEVSERERAMVAAITPTLLRHGVVFCGIDTLTDDDGQRVLSEINTTSIGGFPQAEAQTGRPVLQQTIDELFAYLA